MFGPDKCGSTNKVHFIFRHKNPTSGKYVEHHLKNPPTPVNDKLSHVYSAVIYPNNTLKLLIDGEEKKTADLLSSDFEPTVIPPETIPDPEDKKPEDWDDRAKIPDPEASKPDDWDEEAPREIEDLEAEKPEVTIESLILCTWTFLLFWWSASGTLEIFTPIFIMMCGLIHSFPCAIGSPLWVAHFV